MLHDLLRKYLVTDHLPWYVPLDVDALIAGDYHLYLYDGGDFGWFVIVEADYLSMNEIVTDVETSFPVKVEGWRTLLEYQKNTGKELLSPRSFRSGSVNENRMKSGKLTRAPFIGTA